jgi:Carboxypeptidase regulatory-like domain
MRKLAPVLLLFACLSTHAAAGTGTNSVCSSFETSHLVFRGRVLEVIQKSTPPGVVTYPDGSTALSYVGEMTANFRFEVLEVFKGDPGHEIVIRGSAGEFVEGKEYIVYGFPDPALRTAQTSFRTSKHLIEDPDQDSDLVWLRAYPTAPPTSHIFGKVTMGYGVTDIPSIRITLSGQENLTTYTTEDHSYTFADLLPGTYTVTAFLPAGYVTLGSNAAAVAAAAKGCAEVDWEIKLDTHIKGTVSDSLGNPVPGARIGLLQPAQNRTGFNVVTSQRTDAAGNYDFSSGRPGDYWVALYYWGPNNNEPHTPVFYPSGADSSSAKLIHLGPSANAENIDLVATPALHPVSLHVHVVNPDGSPVIRAQVIAIDPLTPIQALSATADENGDADITLYEGREYRLIANTSGYREPACAGPIKFTAKDGLKLGELRLDKTWDQCSSLQNAK